MKRIAIAAPARKVTPNEVKFAIDWLKEKGFVPVYDERLLHQISFLPVMMIFELLSFRNILTVRILMPFGWCVAAMAAFV